MFDCVSPFVPGAITQLPTTIARLATTWRRVGMSAFPVRILLKFINGSHIVVRPLLYKNMPPKYVQDNSLLFSRMLPRADHSN